MLDVIAIGDCVVDLIIKIPSLPVKNEDVITTESFTRQGGGMCNFLIMAARLGLKTGVIDRLGDDYHGKFISEIFEKEGIDVSHLHFAQGENTTQVFVLVDDKGQHAFIGVLGSGMKLSEQDIADDYIKQSRCLYTCGYTLFSNKARNATIKALKIANKSDILTFFDPGPATFSVDKEVVYKIIEEHTDYLILNSDELTALTNIKNIPDACRKVTVGRCKTVIVKTGADGCVTYSQGKIEKIPGFKVKVVDTTGAGDSFNAAFIYGILKGLGIRKAAIIANATGAAKVQKLGAGLNVPYKENVQAILDELNMRLL
ncbi:MAG: carbohydrate kinase family protein [Candidatus Asgardarchaeia archaeon]